MVAVSSPWASEKLCETIRDLAVRLKASVRVAHVAQPQEDDDGPDDMHQRAEQTLATLTERLNEAKVEAEAVMLFGDDIGRAIVNAAKAHDVSLIILGATGKGRMARLIAGDIPQQVINNAQVPVLVFPPDWSGKV